MGQLPSLATPREAKAVWDGQQRPSARSVARALTQAGRPVHFTTINRWRSQAWRAVVDAHPLDKARAALDSTIPVLTGDPTTTAKSFLEKGSAPDKPEELTDQELIRTAARELAIAQIVVARALQVQAKILVSAKPLEASLLMLSLSKCFKAVVTGLLQAGQLERPNSSFFRSSTPGVS